jgi:cytochrome b involved in lipid metabolism
MSNNNPRSEDDRHMNDSTLPPSAKTTINFDCLESDSKDKGALVSSSISANTTTKNRMPPSRPTSTSRAKVAQRKGFALHDWMHLVQNAKDLAQRKGSPIRTAIRNSELACHNKVEDGWLSLRGKVYNITPYLHYHPGGVHILQSVLGKDATALFDKYHRWVNIEG